MVYSKESTSKKGWLLVKSFNLLNNFEKIAKQSLKPPTEVPIQMHSNAFKFLTKYQFLMSFTQSSKKSLISLQYYV